MPWFKREESQLFFKNCPRDKQAQMAKLAAIPEEEFRALQQIADRPGGASGVLASLEEAVAVGGPAVGAEGNEAG